MKSHCLAFMHLSDRREGELGVGKPEDLPIMTDGDAITPSGSIFMRPGWGFLLGEK